MPEQKSAVVLSSTTYDKLKPTVQIVMPALASLYFSLGQIWGFPAIEEVIGTIAVLTTFLGTILGISTKRYNDSDAAYDGKMVVTQDPGGVKNVTLDLGDTDPESLIDMKKVSFKVQNEIDPIPRAPQPPAGPPLPPR